MYSDVIITDNSWLITVGYAFFSALLIAPLYFVSATKHFKTRCSWVVKVILVLVFGSIQYGVAKNGAIPLYHFFNYFVGDDSVIRYSAIFFMVVYAFFLADWKKIAGRKRADDDYIKNKSGK